MSRRSLRDRVQSQSLRAGSVRVAVGLAFYGGSTYVFLAIAARVLGPAAYADFAVFWGLVYGVGLGATYPFEQEVSRRTALGREHGTSELGVLHAAYRLAGLVVLAVALLLLPLLPHLTHTGFVAALPLWGVTLAAVAGLAAAYVSRGALSGRRRFGAYAGQLGIEGGVRLVLALALAAVAVASPWPWALVVTVALAVAVALTARSGRAPATPVEALPVRDLFVSMAAVGISSVIAQSLVNLGPVVVRVLSGPADQELSGRFLAAALVARLPIFAFAAVQAVLMPHLVEAVVRRDAPGFTHSLRRVLLATGALGAVGVLLCAAGGPQLLRILLGPDFELPRRDIVLLALSIALFLGTLVLQPACLALRQHWRAASAWVAAAATFGLGLLAPLSPLLTVELALIGACAVALAGLALAVARGLRTL